MNSQSPAHEPKATASPADTEADTSRSKQGFRWSGLGPALITASVVLGPGSILLNSKIGAQYGYQFVWLLLLAVVLMMATTAIAAKIGVATAESIGTEIAKRYTRATSLLVGLILLVVTASFQSSNNLGLLYGIQPLANPNNANNGNSTQPWELLVLLAVNGLAIFALLKARELYRFIERLMKVMVAVMLLGFAANLIQAQPSISEILAGCIPSWPTSLSSTDVLTITGLVATTFSIGAAFYQSYLVKQKRLTSEGLNAGLLDTLIGIGALGLMSLMVMLTAASVLHQQDTELKDAADLAMQLRPLFGTMATFLLCGGILAGALSSFLVNAMLGGTVMADALGKNADINGPWTRGLTIVVLLFGMCVGIGVKSFDVDTGSLIIFAQAVTVLGNPILAGVLLSLAHTREVREQGLIPAWLLAIGWLGFLVVLLLSLRTAIVLAGKLLT